VFSRRGLFLPRSAGARWANRGRLAAAGLCLLLAVVAALGAARPRPERPARTVPVAVAARTLPAGQRLAERDLAVRAWPASLRPAGSAATTRQLLGQRLAAPVQRGEAVTAVRLLGRDLAAGLPRDTVAVPVSLPREGAAIIRSGDFIDVLASDTPGDALSAPPNPVGDGPSHRPATVVRHALVLAVLSGAGNPATGTPTTDAVLALDRSAAVRITMLSATQQFTAVLDPP
jgi:Flp pilus assembly protein CpaB